MDDPAGSKEREPSVMAGEGNRPDLKRRLSPNARGSRQQELQRNVQMRHRVQRMQSLKKERERRGKQGKQWRRPPKRGDVKITIFDDLKDASKALCCLSIRDADSVLSDLPFPTKTEATATIWAPL